MAEAAWHVLTREGRERTGEFLLDETVLREAGVTNFGHYAVDPEQELLPDLFV